MKEFYCLIEGPDRSGKDSQAALLMDHLKAEGYDPLLVTEPCSDLPTGRLLRELLKSGEYVETHPGLFLADRMALQIRVIRPALDTGRPVVSVRSFLSTICYQQEHWPSDWLWDIHRVLPVRPSHVIILDVEPREAIRRKATEPGRDEMYETLAIQERVRQRYLDLPNEDRFWEHLGADGWAAVIPPTPSGMDPEESKRMIHDTIWQFVTKGGNLGQ